MKFFLRHKSTSFRTQRIVAKDVDLRPSATKVLSLASETQVKKIEVIFKFRVRVKVSIVIISLFKQI